MQIEAMFEAIAVGGGVDGCLMAWACVAWVMIGDGSEE